METFVGGKDRPGIGTVRRSKSGRTTAGADSADRDVAVGARLDRQRDRVMGAGLEGLPLSALWHLSTQLAVPL